MSKVIEENGVFILNRYLEENSIRSEKETLSQRETKVSSYQEVYEKAKDYSEQKLNDNTLTDEDSTKWLELRHEALMGDPEAEMMLTEDLKLFIEKSNFANVPFPKIYDSLASALFHDVYSFGALKKWDLYKESPSAKITGEEIWFLVDGKFQVQAEKLRAKDHIKELIINLEIANKGVKINAANPRAEIPMKDGSRVTVIVPPAAYQPTIVFRKFTVSDFSFEYQAQKGTISEKDIELHELLFRSNLNTIIAGAVQSAKSTILKTGYASRNSDEVAILVEGTPESFFKKDFPDRLVHEFYTEGEDIEKVMRTALRVDHDYLITQEIRGFEAEMAMQSTQRGSRGALMTYHITNPEATGEQFAQHIVDEYPNRSLDSEIRKVYQQLDIGYIMKKEKNNRKVVDAIYEFCYDHETKKMWINFLMKYQAKTTKWEYNANISKGLIDRISEVSEDYASRFVELMKQKESENPLKVEKIYFN